MWRGEHNPQKYYDLGLNNADDFEFLMQPVSKQLTRRWLSLGSQSYMI
jgi:hypothetical protein